MKFSCNVNQLKRALAIIKGVEDDVLIEFKPEGARFFSQFAGCQALLMETPKESFIMYECEKEKTICVSSEDFHKPFARIMEDDFLFVSVPDEGNMMIINIMKKDRKITRNREFMLPLLEFQNKTIGDMNRFALSNTIVIVSMLLKTAITDMGVSTDNYVGRVTIKATKDKIMFLSGDKGEAKTKVEFHKSEIRTFNVIDNVTCEINLKYVYDFLRNFPDDLYLTVMMETNKPLKILFELSDVKLNALSNTKPFKFTYLIAPFVSTEEADVIDDKKESDSLVGDEGEGLEMNADISKLVK